MSESERRIVRAIEQAVASLPEEKKQYFIGFAEGVAVMASLREPKPLHTSA